MHAKLQLSSFVVTLGTLGILSGAALSLTQATALPIEPGLALLDTLSRRTAGVPNAIIAVVLIVLLMVLALHFTRFGRDLYVSVQ